MNKIILSGNICNDIETKTYNDKMCIRNSIAVKRDFKNKDGEYDTDFFNITLWGQHAEYISKYAKKGYKVLICGRLINNAYENEDGEKKTSNEIQVEQIEIISSRKSPSTTENIVEEVFDKKVEVNNGSEDDLFD